VSGGDDPAGKAQAEAAGVALGSVLRAARLARGESLTQVADATGISRSLLSLIENDRSDITLRRLHTLAEHYGTAVADLLPAPPRPNPIVTRRTERRRLRSVAEGIDVHVLVPDAHRRMLPMVTVMFPGGKDADWWTHEGEELVVVLEGRLLVELDDCPPVVLERGDCAYYDATRAHRWSNLHDGITRTLSVASPPTSL
jgi:transcriptional regulator with XRE-family HTH domain